MNALRISGANAFLACWLIMVSGCSKELSTETGGNPPVDSAACSINKVIIYDNGIPDDSLTAIVENGKIVRYESLTQPGVLTRYTYNGEKLQKTEYLAGSLLQAQTNYVYGSSGDLVNIVTTADLAGTGTPDTVQYYALAYTGGKLSTHKVYGDGSSTNLSISAEFVYTWTGDNISSFEETIYTPAGPISASISVVAGADPNVVTASNPQAFFTDIIVSTTQFGEFWALGLNKNTITRFAILNGQNVDFVYEKTNAGKLRAVDVFGERVVVYRYSCD